MYYIISWGVEMGCECPARSSISWFLSWPVECSLGSLISSVSSFHVERMLLLWFFYEFDKMYHFIVGGGGVEVKRFYQSYEFLPFLGGWRLCSTDFQSLIILYSCRFHLFADFIISWHHEALCQNFYDFHQFIIPWEIVCGGGEGEWRFASSLHLQRKYIIVFVQNTLKVGESSYKPL